ncbi:ferrochelatase [Glycomyces sp. L485]|uniref:ferrochelatase n=1 Tax=Glycomyces sp. L485 TaxID=2909235 RepID=UPI001F4B0CA4|nr:ferrochelatase [Glycomyces sp. L485]MCH7230023.1 ferrochelatase [Glycomyces sp. L485]
MPEYDAVLLVSFGGPEGPGDVLPFLRNVTRGRGIPEERLEEVAEHYHHFGGVSPINQWCREVLDALRAEFRSSGIDLPIYWGNRNWPPMLVDAVTQMTSDGVRRALAICTSAYGSYSSCRQYVEDINAARAAVGDAAPAIDKIRHFFDHPGFVGGFAAQLRASLDQIEDRSNTRVVFTAHSIPTVMEECSGPAGARYSDQVAEAAALVAEHAGWTGPHDVVWQSRSGPPSMPWLEPDVNDHLKVLAAEGVDTVVVSPVGFLSDHIEVLWDLDNEAAETAAGLGLRYLRAGTPEVGADLVGMFRDLVAERVAGAPVRRLGSLPAWDPLIEGCCPARRPPAPEKHRGR